MKCVRCPSQAFLPAAGSSVGICQAPLQCIHKPLGSSCLSDSVGLFLFLCQDKKYASDKYKDIYTELSIVKAKADCDISRLKEQLKAATEAQGEKSPVNTTVSGYGQFFSSSSEQLWVSRANTCILPYKPLCSNGVRVWDLAWCFFAVSFCFPPPLRADSLARAALAWQFLLPAHGWEADGF